MADIPCQEDELVVKRLLDQIEDAKSQLPTATTTLYECVQANYPWGMRSTSDVPSDQKSEERIRFDNQVRSIVDSLGHCVSRYRSLLLDLRIEREHNQKGK